MSKLLVGGTFIIYMCLLFGVGYQTYTDWSDSDSIFSAFTKRWGNMINALCIFITWTAIYLFIKDNNVSDWKMWKMWLAVFTSWICLIVNWIYIIRDDVNSQ
tara:strand:+ start:446 stop:751 length:306 start_codon:yes stop_codon:yes gene_type:complete